MSEQVNSIYDDMPALEDEPETKYTPPEFVRPNLQDILTGDITKDEIKQEIDELRQETGDILEDIMPEIFIDEPFDDSNFVRENIPELRSDQNRLDLDVRENVTTALVSTEVTMETEDPIDVLGNPNVSNILPPIANESFHFMKTDNANDDDDIDFDVADSKIIWNEDNKDLVPLELDDNKIVLTDNGVVILVEQDNTQIEEKPIMSLSEGVAALPPEEKMELVGTCNLVLKRKQANNETGKIKKIRNETDILVKDVKPDVKPQELTVALPPSTEVVKHPIYRKLGKNLKKDQKVAKIVSSRALVKVKDEIVKKENENNMPASVDISTIRLLPWVDFNTTLENTESAQREQVILDILQNNVPSSGDDIYYIYHDTQTNTFSIEVDESSDEIHDFIEGILIIDAQLRVQDFSDKERKTL